MSRTLILAAALGALALPASAASVKVNVAGLDASAVHQKIAHAASTVCQRELESQFSFDEFYAYGACVDATVAEAEAQLNHRYASAQRSGASQN